jgi:hypothetical protein
MELPSSVTTEQGPMKPREPNPGVTAATDAAGLVSAVSKNRSLGAVSAAVSVMNDPIQLVPGKNGGRGDLPPDQ